MVESISNMSISHTQLIATLEQTPATLTRLTAALTDAALDFRTGPDEWSIREILAHLVDDEAFVMRTRLVRMVREENPALASHDEKKWHSHRNTARDKVSELLQDFTIQRAASLSIFTLLRDEDWARTASHPEYGQFNAETWLEHWAEHDLVHIEQIEYILTAFERAKTRR